MCWVSVKQPQLQLLSQGVVSGRLGPVQAPRLQCSAALHLHQVCLQQPNLVLQLLQLAHVLLPAHQMVSKRKQRGCSLALMSSLHNLCISSRRRRLRSLHIRDQDAPGVLQELQQELHVGGRLLLLQACLAAL